LAFFQINTRAAIVKTLYEVQVKHGRTFSQMKRSTIQKLLKKIYKIRVCLSDISYHLCLLRKNKLIHVWERYGTNPDGTHYNLPSNRSCTPKALIYLKQHGIKVAKYLYDWAFLGIKPKRYKDITDLPNQPHVHTRPLRQSAGTFQNIEGIIDSLIGG